MIATLLPRGLITWLLAALFAGISAGAVGTFVFPLRDFDRGSDDLVSEMLALPPGHPLKGFLLLDCNRLPPAIAGDPWMVRWSKKGGLSPYVQQFGLQAWLASGIQKLTGWNGRLSSIAMQVFWIVLHALVFAMMVATFRSRHGIVSSVVFLLAALGCTTIWRWSGSLYWPATPTLAVIGWCLLGPIGRRGWFFSVAALLLGVRFLCGYEFLTCVSLGSTAAAMCNRLLRGQVPNAREAFELWFLGIAMFLIAVTLHVYRLGTLGASSSEAVAAIIEAARYRTVGNMSWIEPKPWYSYAANLVSPFFQGGMMTILVLFGLILAIREKIAPMPMCRTVQVVVASGLAASMSWFVFGFGHARHHPSLTPVVFLQPIFWIALALAADSAGCLLASCEKLSRRNDR